MMKNVIEFPSKKFVQWGAIAQEIVSSLRSMGATKAQADSIAERMRRRWDHDDAGSGEDGPVSQLFPSDMTPPLASADGDHFLSSCQLRLMSARTLLKLARSELRRLPLN